MEQPAHRDTKAGLDYIHVTFSHKMHDTGYGVGEGEEGGEGGGDMRVLLCNCHNVDRVLPPSHLCSPATLLHPWHTHLPSTLQASCVSGRCHPRPSYRFQCWTSPRRSFCDAPRTRPPAARPPPGLFTLGSRLRARGHARRPCC